MKKPTIYDIKRLLVCRDGSPSKYFDRETLRFFGQTMRDFAVYETEEKHVFKMVAKSKKFMRTVGNFKSEAFVKGTLCEPENGATPYYTKFEVIYK